MNTCLASEIKQLSGDGFLTEGHLEAILIHPATSPLLTWLTSDQITLELAQKIKHDAGKNGGHFAYFGSYLVALQSFVCRLSRKNPAMVWWLPSRGFDAKMTRSSRL